MCFKIDWITLDTEGVQYLRFWENIEVYDVLLLHEIHRWPCISLVSVFKYQQSRCKQHMMKQ